ncbi:hypothetical protein FD755_006857 [Muntiacus reevesi]|uniref:Uncharacterized protein n=2 Tax=Muntiacus TaxID=9885 RepID=A0A5J5MX45_MUNRE|nr:hypothetical protein FD754_013632 [Muntiacus muntjak]KAB0384940.1 hypothetical protein FD755_006857 [Muntiacus reevesi]
MGQVSGLLSWTLSRVLWLSGLSDTLEELEVVTESCVEVQEINKDDYLVIIMFTPTVPHGSSATLIGLCLRVKLQQYMNKQINDKELVAAALEKPNLWEIMEQCVLAPKSCFKSH